MFKVIGLGRRAEGTTHEECIDHWVNHHGHLARRLPGLRRYVVNDLGPALDGSDSHWDGMAELWFDSRRAYLDAQLSDAYAATAADGAYLSERLMVFAEAENEIEPAPLS